MTQMAYITLKTPDGRLAGHARLREGLLTLRQKEPGDALGAVFTPAGVQLFSPDGALPVQGPVQAVALVRENRLLAWGLGRDVTLSRAELEGRLAGALPKKAADGGAGMPPADRPPIAEQPGNRQVQLPADNRPPLPGGLRIKRPRPLKEREMTADLSRSTVTDGAEDPTKRAIQRAERPGEGKSCQTLRQEAFSAAAGTETLRPCDDPLLEEELRHQSGLGTTPISAPDRSAAEGPTGPETALPPKDGAAYAREITDSPGDFTNQAIRRAETHSAHPTAAAPGEGAEPLRDQAITAHSLGPDDAVRVEPGPARSYELRLQSGLTPAPTEDRWRQTDTPPLEPPPLQQPDPEELRPSRFPVVPGPEAALSRQASEVAAPLTTQPIPPVAPLPPVAEAGEEAGPAPAGKARKGAETDPDTEAFFALLRRSEEVYRSITEPVYTRPPEKATAPDASALPEPLPFARQGERGTWQGEVDRLLRREEDRRPVENPFPHIFPNAVFQQVRRRGVVQGLVGEWKQGGDRIRIHAVPGAYSPVPPAHLADYTRFIRSRAGGFWVKLETEQPDPPEGN